MRRSSLNHAYRLVWNASAQAFVPAAETARGQGKSGRRALVEAVAGALLAVGAGSALAAGPCPGGGNPITISSTEANCTLDDGDSLLIEAPSGEVIAIAGAAVEASGVGIGNITNNGAVSVQGVSGDGILIENSTVTGSIVNTGTINSGSISGTGIRVLSSSISGSISNSGSISAYSDGIRIDDGSVVTGTISNSGTITGNNVGIGVFGSSSVGNIDNSGTMTIGGSGVSSASGISVQGGSANNITNSGTVSVTASSSGSGAALYVVMGSTGSVTNNGTLKGVLSGTVTGGASVAGMMVGYGTIGGDITNNGLISGSAIGSFTGDVAGLGIVESHVNGSVINNGRITSTGFGVAVMGSNAAISGGLRNGGTISSTYTALRVDSGSIAGAIANSGNISSTGSLSGFGGSISGAAVSLNYATVDGGISNSGTISSAHFDAVKIRGSVVGSITNRGLISGGGYGINIDSSSTVSGGIINSGTIAGGEDDAVLIDGSVAKLIIEGNDTARFIGRVNTPNTEVIVASGSTYTMRGDESFVVNGTLMPPGATSGIVNRFHNQGTLAVAAGATGQITGNYLQDAGATFQTRVDSNGNYGKLNVSGVATLPSNAKINVNVANPAFSFSADRLRGIISAGTLQSDGTFDVTDNSFLFKFTGVKSGNDVDLKVEKDARLQDVVQQAGNKAASGAAAVLDRLLEQGASGELADLFGRLATQSEMNDAVSQTLPTLTGASQQAMQNVMADISRVLQARQDAYSGRASGDAFLSDGHVWLKPFGSWADQNDRDGVSGYDAKTTGLVLGVDGAVSDSTHLGLSFAYARSDIDGNSSVAPSSMDVDLFQLQGYGSHSLDQDTEVSFQLGFGQSKNDAQRRVRFAGTTAKADYDSWTGSAGVGIGRGYDVAENMRFTPSLRADYTWIKDESYRESGAGALNLKVKGRTSDALILGLDGKFSYEFQPGTVFNANLGVGYDALNDDSSITAFYAGAPGAAFRTEGVEVNPWLVRGGVGLAKTLGATEVSLRYDVEHRVDFLNQSASVKVRWAF